MFDVGADVALGFRCLGYLLLERVAARSDDVDDGRSRLRVGIRVKVGNRRRLGIVIRLVDVEVAAIDDSRPSACVRSIGEQEDEDVPGKVPALDPLGTLALRLSPNTGVREGREVPVRVDGDGSDDSDHLETDPGLESRGCEIENAGREKNLRNRRVSRTVHRG